MKDKESPNSSKSKGVKKLYTKLPPQESPFDTSNWENRTVGAVTFDTGAKKRTVRMVDFMKAKELGNQGVTLKEAQRLFLAAKGFTPEQIEQILQADKTIGIAQNNL